MCKLYGRFMGHGFTHMTGDGARVDLKSWEGRRYQQVQPVIHPIHLTCNRLGIMKLRFLGEIVFVWRTNTKPLIPHFRDLD